MITLLNMALTKTERNKMKNITTLANQVIDWAEQRDLLTKNSDPQFLKILEEFGEWAKATLKNWDDEIKDGLGDTLVTVIIYCAQNGKIDTLLDSLSNSKFNEIDNSKEFDIYKNACSVIYNLSSIFHSQGTPQPFLFNLLSSLNVIANVQGFTLYECLQAAYDEIKHRTGRTVNGTFIKSADLAKDNWGVPVEGDK